MFKMQLRSEYDQYLKKHGINSLNGDAASISGNVEDEYDKILGINLTTEVHSGKHRKYMKEAYGLCDLDYEQYFINTTPYNFVINQFCLKIEDRFKKAGVSLSENYYAGEFPTGEINACAVPVTGGYLFLLNSGLMAFLGKYTKLLAHLQCHINYNKEGDAYLEENLYNSGYCYSDIIKYISELIVDYLFLHEPLLSDTLSIPKDKYMTLSRGILLNNCELFILLHEYSHAIAGHLNNNNIKKISTSNGELDAVKKSWSQEHEADIIASIYLMELGFESDQIYPKEYKWIKYKNISNGIINIFILFGLMEETFEIVNEEPLSSSTHPPSSERLKVIIDYIMKKYENHPLEIDNIFYDSVYQEFSWFKLIHQELISLMKERIKQKL